MHQVELLPSPILPQPPEDKWRCEQRAFRGQLTELLQKHRGKFVAIHNGEVVEVGEDKLEVAGRAYERFGYIPIYVGLVTEQPLPLNRLPSARQLQADNP